MKSFTALSQANVDHYNNHPTEHAVITAALAVAAVVVIHKMARRLGRVDLNNRSGQYAR